MNQMKISFLLGQLTKIIFTSNDGKALIKNKQQIYQFHCLTDANSDKIYKAFYNSLSMTELKEEWDEDWKI